MKKKLILAAAIAAAAAVLIVGPSLVAGSSPKKSGTPAARGPAGRRTKEVVSVHPVRVAKAQRRTLQAYIEVNGDVLSENSVAVLPDAGGRLVTLKVQVGSTVHKGDLIAEIDPSKPGTTYSLSPVYAPISGAVTAVPLSVGASVSTSTSIATVGAIDKLEIQTKIPERYVGQLKVGLAAEVTLEAFPGETFLARVSRVAPIVDPASRTKTITLGFVKADDRINPGMFARVKLNTLAYPDRIAVNQQAITLLGGASNVYVLKEDNTVALRKIETGVTVDEWTEVKQGLSDGETVVVQGQQTLSDGAKVNVVADSGSRP